MPDERRARESFLRRAEEFTPLVAVDAEGARYLLRTSDDNITPPLFLKRSRGEIRSMRRVVSALRELGLWKPGGTLIDVGANIGTTTISALHEHGFKRGVACEPEPRNLRLLELNLVANGLGSKTTVCPVAVGESDHEVELLVLDRQAGLHEVRPKGRSAPVWPNRSFHAVRVPQVALDTLAAQGTFDPQDVALLWMDVQGHEAHVLRGAESLTRRGVPVVLELYPEGLKRHGGLGRLKEILRSRYTHFVPLRGRPGQRVAIPIRRLAAEVDRLLAEGLFTDLLVVRAPAYRASSRGAARLAGSVPASPATWRRRRRAAPSTQERREFLTVEARRFSPIVAAEIDGATFLVRTSPGAEERSLFTELSHPRLRRLARVMNALDELGLGASRTKTFVELGAGSGMATVAALTWHGFARALACEPDPDAHRMLELNLTANALRTRARAMRQAPQRLGRDRAGLIWAESVGDVERLSANGVPLVFPAAKGPRSLLRALVESHTHFIVVSSGRHSRPRSLSALSGLSATARRGHLLVVRLPAP